MTENKPTVALDIETISPGVDDPNPQNPDHVELLCIGVGYRKKPQDSVVTHVLFRRGTSPEHELELLDRLYEWIITHRSDRLITYNGTKFDLLHLRGRAERAERKAGESIKAREKIETLLEMHEHVDLFERAKEYYEYWPKLEEVCEDHGIDIPETEYKGRTVENHMIPKMGESYLASVERGCRHAKLQRTLIEYTQADIAPLFELDIVLREQVKEVV